MSTISFSDCLAVINLKDKIGNPFPFVLDCYTLNRNSKKGGLIKRYKNAKLLAWKKGNVDLDILLKSASKEVKPRKDANHFQNRTRNIELENGDIRKIHLRLIDSINGKKVLP